MEFFIRFIKYDIPEKSLESLAQDQVMRDKLFGNYLGETYDAENQEQLIELIQKETGHKILTIEFD